MGRMIMTRETADSKMKTLALLACLLLLDSVISGEYAWETSRIDIEAREADLAFRKAKTEKTSIIVYDKHQMSEEEVDAEIDRIVSKCEELECPCEVRKLGKIGVLEVIWSCDPHPPVSELELDGTKETGAEDQLVHAYTNSPPPTDPRFSEQWALQDLSNNADINIAEGWAEYLSDAQGGSATGPSVVVAVIDTGIDYTHPELKDVMWTNPGEIAGDGIDNDGNGVVDDVYGADYSGSSPSGDPIDRQGHGTHCSGIIAATPNNGKGIAGVASYAKGKVKLMALKGLSDSGGGTISGLLACLNYAIDKGAKISSNSWGGGTVSGIEDIWDAVLRNNLDHLFIAAAGNSNRLISDSYKSMTCGLKEPNLLCVASSTVNDARSSFSNYGKDYVHVFAPGSDILSSTPNNGYKSYSGTSMACPMVSGLAALIMTMRDGMSAQQIRSLIEANVRVKTEYADFVSSSGLIDVGKTIKALKGSDGNGTNPEPPTCDYAPYCAIVDCSKSGAAALCPDQCKRCTNIKIRTEAWGNENSYAIGTCVSTQQYATRKNYEEECSLASGTYNLDCKCTYGDGWHGGYVEIDGAKYCEGFRTGHKTSVPVVWN